MGFKIGKFLPVIGSLAGNMIAPGIGGQIGGMIGAGLAGKSGNKSAVNQINALDSQNYGKYLQAASPNWTNASGATSTWEVDPNTGKRTQTLKFGPEEQKRRDMWNQLMGNRLQMAGGIDISRYGQGGMDFSSNPRLAAYQKMGGGMGKPNAPVAPYELTPKTVAPTSVAKAPELNSALVAGLRKRPAIPGLEEEDVGYIMPGNTGGP